MASTISMHRPQADDASADRLAEPGTAFRRPDEPMNGAAARHSGLRPQGLRCRPAACPGVVSQPQFRKVPSMLQSHVIDIDGVFVGVAVRLENGFRFVATDLRLEEINERTWPSLDDIRRLARRTLTQGVLPRPTKPDVARRPH